MSEYEDRDLKGADKCTLPSGVLHGYLCPTCISLFESEEQAIQCMKAHDELSIRDMIFSTGERFPLEILVERIEGKEVTEIATYTRTKIDKVGEKNEPKS